MTYTLKKKKNHSSFQHGNIGLSHSFATEQLPVRLHVFVYWVADKMHLLLWISVLKAEKHNAYTSPDFVLVQSSP
jgi:hypothetical protein